MIISRPFPSNARRPRQRCADEEADPDASAASLSNMNGIYDVSCAALSLQPHQTHRHPGHGKSRTTGAYRALQTHLGKGPHDARTAAGTSHSASSLIFACSSSAVASCFAREAFCMNRRLSVPLLSVFPAMARETKALSEVTVAVGAASGSSEVKPRRVLLAHFCWPVFMVLIAQPYPYMPRVIWTNYR